MRSLFAVLLLACAASTLDKGDPADATDATDATEATDLTDDATSDATDVGVTDPADTDASTDTDTTDAPVEDTGIPADGCEGRKVRDCRGECQPRRQLGDGECQEGSDFGAAFNCEALRFDLGDCAGDLACDDKDIADCDGVCHPARFVGDGGCDDGTSAIGGYADFNCDAFELDGGDCAN